MNSLNATQNGIPFATTNFKPKRVTHNLDICIVSRSRTSSTRSNFSYTHQSDRHKDKVTMTGKSLKQTLNTHQATEMDMQEERAVAVAAATAMEGQKLEMFEVGPCQSSYQLGFSIGQRFCKQIRNRIATDLILQDQLLSFAQTPKGKSLIGALSDNNRRVFPAYWDELVGTAEGSGTPLLHVILLNFRKEILPFVPKREVKVNDDEINADCSTILVVRESMAMAAHNEDANVALVGHTYLVKGTLPSGLSFTAYTYAGELPSCAFGFNNHGLAFTLNSVPPTEAEIAFGGIGRNFFSRDLLEARSIDEGVTRIRSSEASVGHSYNLIDIKMRRILNVETASRNRVSVHEVGPVPFFHANMYCHLQVEQAQDENSISRQQRAALLANRSKDDFLSLLGDTEDKRYPIYMTGPTLHTLCTAVIDLDERTLSIFEGNPKKGKVSYVFPLPY